MKPSIISRQIMIPVVRLLKLAVLVGIGLKMKIYFMKWELCG